MALATSMVTVPTFGFGMRPRGPRTLPRRPTTPIMSGVAMTVSKSRKPSSMRFCEVIRAHDVGAGVGGLGGLSPLANTATRTVAPVPCGSTTAPRTIWSACFGSTPRLMATSTVWSNFVARVSTVFLSSSKPSAMA